MTVLLPSQLCAFETDNFEFTANSDGTNTVSIGKAMNATLTGELTIPATVSFEGTEYTVTSIKNFGFEYCSKITSVTLPNTITTIGSWGFSGCENLKAITLPKNLTTINYHAFQGCIMLDSINIPSKVSSIEDGVFSWCTHLRSITVDEDNTYFTSQDGMLLSADKTKLYAYAFAYPGKDLVLPETINYIDYYTFAGNSTLKSIVVPSGVTKILEGTFIGCTSLANVSMPDGITNIGYDAFYGCSSLVSITIPSKTTAISNWAFAECSALNSVIVRQVKPIEINSNIFDESTYTNATLYVPTGRAKYFKDAQGWSNFATIKETDMDGVDIPTSPYANIEENQMILGYYTSDLISTGGYGGANAGLYKTCIGFSREQIRPFAGNRIVNVRFALHNTDIQGLKVWIGSTRDKKDLCTQTVPTLQEGWNEVALANPYTITGDSIFVGIEYRQNGGNYPLSVVSDGAEKGSYYIYGPYYGTNEDEIWLSPNTSRSLSLQCIVEGDQLPLYDVHTVRMELNATRYMKAGEDYSGYLYLRNWGKKPLNSITYTCEIDGKELQNGTIQNLGRGITYQHIYIPTDNISAGKHEIAFRVKEINGEKPLFPDDDRQTVEGKFITKDMGRDMVLLDQFTATWCPWCPRGHRDVAQLMEERDDIALVSSHLDDTFTCDASEAYGIFTSAIPATFYDRYAPLGATSLSNIGINNAKGTPSLAKLELQAGYDEKAHEATISVKGKKNDEFDLVEENAHLTVLLTEDSIVAPQYDGDLEQTLYDYMHQGVLRTSLSNIWGDPVEWNGDEFEMTYTVKMEADWVKNHMNVVAFLAKPFNGSNYDEIGVMNCNALPLSNAETSSGISDIGQQDVTIRLEGRRFHVTGSYQQMKVYAPNGQLVDNCNLPAGTYIAKVQTDKGNIIRKIAVR